MKPNMDAILKIIDYIESHLTDNLDLDSIANVAGYSKYHLNRLFMNITGCTIYQYIQKRRLTEAARQLVFTDYSIISIALNSGYETQQSFSMAFKKVYEESPQIYRKNKDFNPVQLKFDVYVYKDIDSTLEKCLFNYNIKEMVA